ncbi:hypothetical protein JJB09_25540 [Rhizobium sp. KVB221]|uniref:Uncharacterized protein n=1 Tax=Rhizobium setariae TaxID=2801340 RepID=A0A936YV16_9HYPH|nr:hypothetical protein [Rhizobium setariae]MBL0375379.1 hypothetical protein [Rhizobium setariae]
MSYDLNHEIEEEIVMPPGDAARIGRPTLTAQLLMSLLEDDDVIVSSNCDANTDPTLPQCASTSDRTVPGDVCAGCSASGGSTRYTGGNLERTATARRELERHESIRFDATSMRLALADAALFILSRNLRGADQIWAYLNAVFSAQPGAMLTLDARIKAGTVRPSLGRFAQTVPRP